MQIFDFYNDQQKEYLKKNVYMLPEWFYSERFKVIPPDYWLDNYMPRNSQVLQDICTILIIVLWRDL